MSHVSLKGMVGCYGLLMCYCRIAQEFWLQGYAQARKDIIHAMV